MVEPKPDQELDYTIPGPPSSIKNTLEWADKSEAELEAKNWKALDQVREANDRRWLKAYGWVLLVMTVAFAGIFLIALISWAWHYIMPECLHWLADMQLSKIQSVLFSGGMGAVISGIVRGQINKS